MKRRSFFWKLLGGNLLVIAALAAVGGMVSYGYLNRAYQRQNQASQEQMVWTVHRHFESLASMDPDRINVECSAYDKLLSPMRLTVIASDGRVLGDSGADTAGMAPHKTPDRPEILEALNGRRGQDVRLSETLNREFRYVAVPIRRNDEIVGAVRLAMPIRAIQAGQSLIFNTVLLATLAGAGAAAALALLVSWLWSAPLKQIVRAAGQIAAGDLDRDGEISGTGELAELADALNRMRRDIAAQIHLIAAQRAHLQTAVSNLREGVVEVSTGRISWSREV